MRFIKMHGIGNDFLFLDALGVPELLDRSDIADLAQRMCDRHSGVGADGLIVLSAPRKGVDADLTMRIINSDGSEGGMCGNGLRCAAKFVVERGYVVPSDGGSLTVDTGSRVVRVTAALGPAGQVTAATVDMGRPVLDLPGVPVEESRLGPAQPGRAGQFKVNGRVASFVSMGNPHMVAFVDEPVETIDLAREGPAVEHHAAFPRRMNLQIVNAVSLGEVRVRTWERGAGMTRGCGSGACAVVVAGASTGRLARRVLVHMPGGDLDVRWDESGGHVLMTGPAEEVFQGDWPG